MVLILRYKTSMVLQVVDFGCAKQYILMVLILVTNIDGFTGCRFRVCRAVHFDGFNIALQNLDGFAGCRFRVCRAVHFDGFNIALQNINGFAGCGFRVCQAVHFDGFNIAVQNCRGITRIHRSPSRPRPAVRPTAILINIHEHPL